MYPKMKYHPLRGAVWVGDELAEAALGEGWTDGIEPELALVSDYMYVEPDEPTPLKQRGWPKGKPRKASV